LEGLAKEKLLDKIGARNIESKGATAAMYVKKVELYNK